MMTVTMIIVQGLMIHSIIHEGLDRDDDYYNDADDDDAAAADDDDDADNLQLSTWRL